MNWPLRMYLTLSDRSVEEIEVVFAPGQRDRAWRLCQQVLPELERLEASLAAPAEGEHV